MGKAMAWAMKDKVSNIGASFEAQYQWELALTLQRSIATHGYLARRTSARRRGTISSEPPQTSRCLEMVSSTRVTEPCLERVVLLVDIIALDTSRACF